MSTPTSTEEADALVRLVNYMTDRLERAEDALEALHGELKRCIEVAPNDDARTAYQWVQTYLLGLPGAAFIVENEAEQAKAGYTAAYMRFTRGAP